MNAVAEPPGAAGPVQAPLPEDEIQIGVVTRAMSWMLDAVVINAVAIGAGIGVSLFFSIIPVSKDLSSVLKPIAAAVYAVWAALYFIVFWSATGQTPGARLMHIRLVPAKGGRVKPRWALVRWVAMNLAMIPLFAGYYPIAFGRRGFPDWLAHTLVLDAPQLSLAQTRREALQAGRGAGATDAVSPGNAQARTPEEAIGTAAQPPR